MIKGIIYDMDDLMVNSDPLHARTWEILFKKHGYSFNELPENMKADFIGMRVIDILKEIVEHFNLDSDIGKLYQERTDIFLDLVKNELEAMPGLHGSLDLLREHKYPIALASSGVKKYIDLVLDKFNIAKYFDAIISGDDVGKGKPDPETYKVAARKLSLLPSECLVLEDASKGIEAAKKAGCICFAIKNPNTPPQDHSQADKIFNSLNDITIEIIEKYN